MPAALSDGVVRGSGCSVESMRYTVRMVELIIPRTCCGTVDAALFVVQGLSDMSATIPRTIRPNIPGIFCVIIALYFLGRSEEHTSELQSLMRISYAVFCLKKQKHQNNTL